VSELLPLFPLSTVLFPGALLPLHVFEPRYRLLVRRCLERERPFGVVLIRTGEEVGSDADPYAIGTEARIVGVTPLPDGRSYIVTRGERRFAVDQLISDAEPYLVGRVRYLSELEGADARDQVDQAIEALGAYQLAVGAVTEDALGERALPDELKGALPVDVAYKIASALVIDAKERQNLLQLETASERLREETRLLARETALLRDLLVRLRARGERAALN
jgi:Lon protease-like protein